MPKTLEKEKVKRKRMQELNVAIAENLGVLLMGFEDEVVRGLLEYLKME